MPTQGDLYIAPFTDEMLYMEQVNKAQFWQQKTFYSLDLSSLKEAALLEYFSQPFKVCMLFVLVNFKFSNQLSEAITCYSITSIYLSWFYESLSLVIKEDRNTEVLSVQYFTGYF